MHQKRSLRLAAALCCAVGPMSVSLAVATLGMVAPGAMAQAIVAEEGPLGLDELVGHADLVFRGVVERIDHRLSRPAPGQEPAPVPHTFVTYRVSAVLHGEAPGETLTLRFVGGPTADGLGVLMPTITPLFDIGDEDILFVSGNGESLSPLVGDKRGRVRVIGDQAYSDGGRSLAFSEDGRLRLGAAYKLEEVRTTTISGVVFARPFSSKAVDGPSDAILGDAFQAAVTAAAARAPKPAAPFVNADPDAEFDGPDLTPAAPPAP